MTPRVLASAVTVALALLGCGQQASTPTPGPVAGSTCDTTGHSTTDPKRCVVDVSATISSGTCTVTAVNPDPEVLKGNGYARIVWKLDADFRFCSTLGDGAFLKQLDADAQFQNPLATDQPNGDPDTGWSQCKKHFRIEDVNAASTSGKPYEYALQFHTKDGRTVCKKDPLIRNG